MKIIVTGGAGFIGSNTAKRFLEKGAKVVVFDNLSRRGAAENLKWLETIGGDLNFVKGDIRNFHSLRALLERHADVNYIIHLAGQVAVTTSVVNPREDFEVNAVGTFNVLEAVRSQGIKPLVLESSTNKVYGGMENVRVIEKTDGYAYQDFPQGIPESMNLDFHSPYGCSKGAADQYMHDYYRIYGIPTVVLRQSCIYGYRQFGIEDQGWVAWFLIAAVLGKPITIYGSGKQVRDVLFIEDLVDLYEICYDKKDLCAGKIYNVGGGPKFTLSVWHQFGLMIEKLLDRKLKVQYSDWRPGDQKIYVSDIRRICNELGWTPGVSPEKGISLLYGWILENKEMLRSLF
ncbi:MAG: SDR family NAD(P)-dependent oxidoreductase [Candidatus Omnitrophica bacterium]|nr:SDR family NAD(P)-dependent oxidoreductase [Candidatus Omnitrophota bacterium]